MLRTSHAIVLRTTATGDHGVVLKAWAEGIGARSYMVRIGRKQGRHASTLQPLNRLEIVAEERPDGELHAVREVRVARPYLRLHREPMRSAIALFVQEVLYRVLHTESHDPAMDQFLDRALETMDSAEDLRCFPVVFLLQLSGHLGFFPGPPEEGEDHFDLREGCFVAAGSAHGDLMGPPLSTVLMSLLGTDLDSLESVVVPPGSRRALLDHLLLYFRMHVDGLGELRSPDVLHAALA